jgi:hypothetical protein
MPSRTRAALAAAVVTGTTLLAAPGTGTASAQAGPACTITGTARNDVLRGTAGPDVLCGLGGNDTLIGLGADDVLLGGPGNDTLDGGPGNDRADGGAGSDLADYSTAGAPVRVDLAAGTATGAGTDTVTGVENVTGGPGADRLAGDGAANRLDGGPGSDVVTAGPGNDTVIGGPGDDRLAGGDGTDTLQAGNGSDVCRTGDRVVGACVLDGAGPGISGVTVPAVVRAGDTVTFTWRVVDAAGVQFTGLTVGWAPGIYTGCGFGQSATLVSGSAANGTWSLTCAFPADAVATEYSVQVNASDLFGTTSLSEWVTFRIDGPNGDSSPPTYADVRLVGTARVGELLTITWTAADPSGVNGAIMWVAGAGGSFANTSGRAFAEYLSVERTCDAAGARCTFTQTVRLASFGSPGTWTLWISATDVFGNKILEPASTFPVLGAAVGPTTTPPTTTPPTTTPPTTTPPTPPTTTPPTTTTTPPSTAPAPPPTGLTARP